MLERCGTNFRYIDSLGSHPNTLERARARKYRFSKSLEMELGPEYRVPPRASVFLTSETHTLSITTCINGSIQCSMKRREAKLSKTITST